MNGRPAHGGRLNRAAETWGLPVDEWLDLSTGINPVGWPVPPVPASFWQRLPEDDDGLSEIVRAWAGLTAGGHVLPVAGSQAAIQALPRLRGPCRVGVPSPAYDEHRHCWALAGHTLYGYSTATIEAQLDDLDVVVWIQPNNPTGEVVSPSRLLQWHARLAARGGWLIIDEAFALGSELESLAQWAHLPGLIVLRSLGKFFGLAGIRAGVVFAQPELCQSLDHRLGPWCLTGPTRFVMAQALLDVDWQEQASLTLRESSRRLRALLMRHGLAPAGGTTLFQYVRHEQAGAIAAVLARRGILVRHFKSPQALRFGLPATEAQWLCLDSALEQASLSGFRRIFSSQS